MTSVLLAEHGGHVYCRTRCDNCGTALDGLCAADPQRCVVCSKPKGVRRKAA